MIIRAKFQLQEHQTLTYDGKHFSNKFTFRPFYDPTIPEDKRFNEATPMGEIVFWVDNPKAVEFYKQNLSKYFYIDQTLAETPGPGETKAETKP